MALTQSDLSADLENNEPRTPIQSLQGSPHSSSRNNTQFEDVEIRDPITGNMNFATPGVPSTFVDESPYHIIDIEFILDDAVMNNSGSPSYSTTSIQFEDLEIQDPINGTNFSMPAPGTFVDESLYHIIDIEFILDDTVMNNSGSSSPSSISSTQTVESDTSFSSNSKLKDNIGSIHCHPTLNGMYGYYASTSLVNHIDESSSARPCDRHGQFLNDSEPPLPPEP